MLDSHLSGVEWPAVPAPQAASVLALVSQFEETEWWPMDRLVVSQLDQLTRLITHFCRTSPLVADRMCRAGIREGDRVTVESFQRIPFLTRLNLQDQRGRLLSTEPPSDHGRTGQVSTSGSMGSPVHVHKSEVSEIFHHALNLRSHLWHKRIFTHKFATIMCYVDDHADFPDGCCEDTWTVGYRTGPAVSLNCANCSLEDQLTWLERMQPGYIMSYPTNLAALAELSAEKGISLPGLHHVLSFSEAVSDDQRDVIRRVWGVPLIDAYSSAEASLMALQCPDSELYHVMSEHVILEILDENDQICGPGETGRVMVTDLHNFLQPIIRYETGDMAEPTEPCSCGRGLPSVKRVFGRVRNFMRLATGERIFPYILGQHDLGQMAPIRQLQVIQRDYLHMDVVMAVKRRVTVDEEKAVLMALEQGLGHSFELRPIYVAEIPRPASGKFEDFRCEIPENDSP